MKPNYRPRRQLNSKGTYEIIRGISRATVRSIDT